MGGCKVTTATPLAEKDPRSPRPSENDPDDVETNLTAPPLRGVSDRMTRRRPGIVGALPRERTRINSPTNARRKTQLMMTDTWSLSQRIGDHHVGAAGLSPSRHL